MAAVLVSNEIKSITTSNVQVYVGKSGTATSEWTGVDITIPSDVKKPLDIAFILDNTGSMSDAITGSKNSIVAFAQTLEAGGVDARFGLVTYGDSAVHPTPSTPITSEGGFLDFFNNTSHPRPVMDFGTAASLETILSTEVFAEGGGDGPENPLDAIMYAYNNFSWRSGAQRVLIVITDINGHQSVEADTSSKNKCTTTATNTVTALAGNAVIYSVSPDYTDSQWPYADVRRLADGLGEGRVTAETNTGGKWVTFESSGFDLTQLGLSTVLTNSTLLRFNYTFTAGTWYIHVLVDTNGDGTMDADAIFTLTVSGGSGFTTLTPPVAASSISRERYVGPPNN